MYLGNLLHVTKVGCFQKVYFAIMDYIIQNLTSKRQHKEIEHCIKILKYEPHSLELGTCEFLEKAQNCAREVNELCLSDLQFFGSKLSMAFDYVSTKYPPRYPSVYYLPNG